MRCGRALLSTAAPGCSDARAHSRHAGMAAEIRDGSVIRFMGAAASSRSLCPLGQLTECSTFNIRAMRSPSTIPLRSCDDLTGWFRFPPIGADVSRFCLDTGRHLSAADFRHDVRDHAAARARAYLCLCRLCGCVARTYRCARLDAGKPREAQAAAAGVSYAQQLVAALPSTDAGILRVARRRLPWHHVSVGHRT